MSLWDAYESLIRRSEPVTGIIRTLRRFTRILKVPEYGLAAQIPSRDKSNHTGLATVVSTVEHLAKDATGFPTPNLAVTGAVPDGDDLG
ncbi:MAG: hypothetical protein Q9184_006197 [Pyrenodesmia sp. 2 TL-2023]